MAGAVSVDLKIDLDEVLLVTPRICPAREASWPWPYCVISPLGDVIAQCPFMYSSQGRHRGLWTRHAGVAEFAEDCRENTFASHRVRVLCLRAESGSLEPGARSWGVNASYPHGKDADRPS
jgi:hypothetical protein